MKKIMVLFLVVVFLVTSSKMINVYAEENEIIEDEIVEEEPKKGYLETNWQTILSTFLGTSGGMALLFFIISKIFKRLSSTSKDSDSNVKFIEKLASELKVEKETIEALKAQCDELINKLESEANEVFGTLKEELIQYRGNLQKRTDLVLDILKIAYLNEKSTIESGIALEIDKRIKEYEEKE